MHGRGESAAVEAGHAEPGAAAEGQGLPGEDQDPPAGPGPGGELVLPDQVALDALGAADRDRVWSKLYWTSVA